MLFLLKLLSSKMTETGGSFSTFQQGRIFFIAVCDYIRLSKYGI